MKSRNYIIFLCVILVTFIFCGTSFAEYQCTNDGPNQVVPSNPGLSEWVYRGGGFTVYAFFGGFYTNSTSAISACTASNRLGDGCRIGGSFADSLCGTGKWCPNGQHWGWAIAVLDDRHQVLYQTQKIFLWNEGPDIYPECDPSLYPYLQPNGFGPTCYPLF